MRRGSTGRRWFWTGSQFKDHNSAQWTDTRKDGRHGFTSCDAALSISAAFVLNTTFFPDTFRRLAAHASNVLDEEQRNDTWNLLRHTAGCCWVAPSDRSCCCMAPLVVMSLNTATRSQRTRVSVCPDSDQVLVLVQSGVFVSYKHHFLSFLCVSVHIYRTERKEE